MASLQITRDNEMLVRKVANEVLHQLQEKHPDQEFEFDADKIRGKNQVVYLSNLVREVRAAPKRKDEIIKRFVDTLSQPATAELGHEVWEEVRGKIVPVLKPRDYVKSEGPTQHFLTTEWLCRRADLLRDPEQEHVSLRDRLGCQSLGPDRRDPARAGPGEPGRAAVAEGN